MLLARAEFLERLAQYETAQHELTELLPRLASQPELLTRAHLRAAWIGYWTGQLGAGRAHIQITLSHARAYSALHADSLYVAGLIEQSAARLEHARTFYERSLALYRVQENQYGESSALVNLADIAVDSAALDDALRYGEQALALSARIGKRSDQAAANVILGSLSFTLGAHARAETAYAQALGVFRDLGNGTGESIARRGIALLQLRRGETRAALVSAEHAAQVAQELHSSYREGMARILIGDAQLALRRTVQAEESYIRAFAHSNFCSTSSADAVRWTRGRGWCASRWRAGKMHKRCALPTKSLRVSTHRHITIATTQARSMSCARKC